MIKLNTVKLFMGFIITVILSSNINAVEKSDPWLDSYGFETQGNYEQAITALKPSLKVPLESEFAWLRIGWLRYLQGNYNASIQAYKKAYKRNSGSYDAQLGITLPLLAQQRWREAAQYAEQVIKKSKWNYTAQIRMLTSESAQGQWQKVKQRAAALAKRYPTETLPWVYWARAENWLGNNSQTIKIYKQVLMRSPTNVEAKAILLKNT